MSFMYIKNEGDVFLIICVDYLERLGFADIG